MGRRERSQNGRKRPGQLDVAYMAKGGNKATPPKEGEDIPPESLAESGDQNSSQGDAPNTPKQEVPDDVDAPAESEDPQGSDEEAPGESSSGGDRASSSEGKPAASSSSGMKGESTASSLPDSLQSSQNSSGPDGSSSDAYMRKIALKKGAQSRYQMYLVCNMFEQAAREMLKYALDNPMEQVDALRRRADLLTSLYDLRHYSDVDDEFTQEEYEREMQGIRVFRSKMGRLANKEDEFVDSSDEESSDDEIDDADDMDVLKEARKMMEFQFGKNPKQKRM